MLARGEESEYRVTSQHGHLFSEVAKQLIKQSCNINPSLKIVKPFVFVDCLPWTPSASVRIFVE